MRSAALMSAEVGAGRCFSGPSTSVESTAPASGLAGCGVFRPDPQDQRNAMLSSGNSLPVTGTPEWEIVASDELRVAGRQRAGPGFEPGTLPTSVAMTRAHGARLTADPFAFSHRP